MPFIVTQSGATALGIVDVCKTPPLAVPVPYVNIGVSTMGLGFVFNVTILASPVHNLLTTIPMTSANEPGAMGGVVSGIIKGPARYLIGSFSVIAGCAPVAKLLSTTLQNAINAPGLVAVMSQIKVMALK